MTVIAGGARAGAGCGSRRQRQRQIHDRRRIGFWDLVDTMLEVD
jgi:hypothetical protein